MTSEHGRPSIVVTLSYWTLDVPDMAETSAVGSCSLYICICEHFDGWSMLLSAVSDLYTADDVGALRKPQVADSPCCVPLS